MALSPHNFERVVLVNPETGDDYALMAAGDDFSGPAVAKHDFIRAILVNPETGNDYKATGGAGGEGFIVLAEGEPVPEGTPIGTVIVRTVA